MNAKVKRGLWVSAAAVLAALIIVVTVFCFVRVKDGFNTGETPFAVQVSKNGGYSETAKVNAGADIYLQDGANFDKIVKRYYGMTSFIAMRGIVEGRWFPKAKLEGVVTSSEIRALAAAADKDGKPAYLLNLTYKNPQSAEIKVAKGTKDNPNSVTIDIDKYNEGDKVPFEFTSVVFTVEDNNFIEGLTVYAFKWEDLKEDEFIAYKLTVQANRIYLYRDCDKLFS